MRHEHRHLYLDHDEIAHLNPMASLQGSDRQLAIPHLSVPSIASINWRALRAVGFKGVVFDKDNTLSQPYAMEVRVYSVGNAKDASRGRFR